MPEMDEGAFVLDYYMPTGTSLAKTDEVARRIDKILMETPDVSGYLRRTGAENGIYATGRYRGDIEVSLKPPGKRRPMDEIFEVAGEELEAKVPELEIELVALIHDQIDDLVGIDSPVEVKIFGPDGPSSASWPNRSARSSKTRGWRSGCDHDVPLGNPDHRACGRTSARHWPALGLTEQDIENQLNAALYGQVATTLPEQDRMTDIRVRYPDTVRFDRDRLEQLPIALPPAAADGQAGGQPGRAAAPFRAAWAKWRRSSPSAVRMPCGARTSSRKSWFPASGEGLDLGKINRASPGRTLPR